MNTKPTLAFDCAGPVGSVAVQSAAGTFTQTIEQTQQAVALVPTMQALLKQAGIGFDDAGEIITTVGPGSFTGVRVGLATLHGLVAAHGTPIKTLTSLEAMAWEAARHHAASGMFYVALRAGKGEVYAQKFALNGEKPIAMADIFLAPETKADWDVPCYGNVVDETSPQFILVPRAETLCAIAEHLPTAALADAVPCYVRPPDAKIPATPAWLSAT